MFGRFFRRGKPARGLRAVRCPECHTSLLASPEQWMLHSGGQKMWLFCPKCLCVVAGEVYETTNRANQAAPAMSSTMAAALR
jgi:hypothetical protein